MAREVCKLTGTWYSLIFTCVISGYRLFKFVLFLVGFLIAFFFSYIMCTEHLSDVLSGTLLEYKDQVKYLKILMKFTLEVNSKTAHAPPPPPPHPFQANPQAFDFFQKFWSNSLVCWQFRWSNAPSASASRSVKSPIQQWLFNKFPVRQTIYWSVSVLLNTTEISLSLGKLSYRGLFIPIKLFIPESLGFFKGCQMLQQNSEYKSNGLWTRYTCWVWKEF